MSTDIITGENALEFYIESIELEHFLGFAKPRIKNLKATFDKKLQILNSTNGCGKTTFISELNPFPIEKSLFGDDGYKIIIFVHNGKRYKSCNDSKRNNLFDMETGENLNQGGTRTQHIALIKSMFNLTPFLWSTAMGSVQFTDADKNLRRTWIETISGIDFNYPFTVYKAITSELNSLKGASKHINIQLTNEASKLLREEEIKELINTKDIYTNVVKEILISRDSSITKADKVRLGNEIERLEKVAKDSQLSYNNLTKFINPFGNVNSLESLREYHSELKGNIITITNEIDKLVTRLADRSELLRKLDKGSGIKIEDINKEIRISETLLRDSRRVLSGNKVNRKLFQYLKEAKVCQSLLSNHTFLFKEVITHCTTTKDYPDDALVYPYSLEHFKELSFKESELSTKLKRNQVHLTNLTDNLEELSKQHTIDCPDCGSNFLPNRNTCDKLTKEVDELSKSIPILTKQLEDITYEADSYRLVAQRREYTLDWLASHFNNDQSWYVNILSEYLEENITLVELSNKLRSDENTIYHIDVGISCKEELTRLESIVKEYNLIKGIGDVEELDKEVNSLETKISKLRKERSELELELETVTDTGKLYQKHVTLLTTLKDSLTDLSNKRTQYIKVLSNISLEAVGNDLQVQLANVTKKVNDNDILTNLINSLQGMLDKTNHEIAIFKQLELAMNPSTGIIAEQLVGYVDAFAKQLTNVVSKLWGYPLVIHPCSIDGRKGMDYLFPFTTGGKPIPDVSKGSKSQLSVINLAVMLCTRISLGLNGLPLFLDEVGGGFDTVHNQKLASFIRELLTNYGCSNVFLVHHDAAVRNSLGPHDTIVFDKTQVIVCPNYNEHVEMTHFKETVVV